SKLSLVANLTQSDKRYLEEFLQMRSGYVLDFSNRTFQEFVLDNTALDIDDVNVGGSGSKASRLRHFWANQPDRVGGKLLNAFTKDRLDGAPSRDRCVEIAERLIKFATKPKARRYYTARNQPGSLSLNDLYDKLKSLYLFFRDKDYL